MEKEYSEESENQAREEFEKWWEDRFPRRLYSLMDMENDYRHGDMETAWLAAWRRRRNEGKRD